MKIRVELNGTQENLYGKLGLTQNPFDQLGKGEYADHILTLQSLGGVPIPKDFEVYIRTVLVGWSEEFIDLCISQYQPGQLVKFVVEFPTP